MVRVENVESTYVIDFKKATQDVQKFARDTGKALDPVEVINLELNTAKLQASLSDARARLRLFKKQGDEQATIKAQLDVNRLSGSVTEAKRQLNNYRNTGEKELSRLQSKFNETNETIKGQGKILSGLKGAFVGLFAIGSIVEAGKAVFNTTSQFQRFDAVLTNALGSQAEATKSLDLIRDIASKTPFELDKLTDSYIKLVNRGFKPTEAEIIKLGDLAASQGKEFDQLTEAILDAQTGEFERLKEFGIRASSSGDEVTFAFKGVEQTVAKTDEEIRNYILSLGDLDGVQGLMAVQAETLGGRFSNLQDNITQLALKIGTALTPVFNGLITAANFVIDNITAFAAGIAGLATALSIGPIIAGVTSAIAALSAGAGIATVATGALSSALTLLGGPIALIAGAVVGLGILVVNNRDLITEYTEGLVDRVSNAFNNILSLLDNLGGGFSFLADIIRFNFDVISRLFINLADNLSSLVSFAKAIVTGDFAGAWGIAKNIIASQANIIIDVINSVIQAFNKLTGLNVSNVGRFTETTEGIKGARKELKNFERDLSSISKTDAQVNIGVVDTQSAPIRGGGGGGGRSSSVKQSEDKAKAEQKAQEEIIKANIKSEEILRKTNQKNKDDFIKTYDKIEDGVTKNIDNISKEIEKSGDAIQKLDEKIADVGSGATDDLLSRFLDVQDALSADDIDSGQRQALEDELALIQANTSELERQEAIRREGLSTAEKILEDRDAEISDLEAQRTAEQERLALLEETKNQQVAIQDFLKERQIQNEKDITNATIFEINKRIAAYQAVGVLSGQATEGAIAGNNTTNTSTTTVNVKVEGVNDPVAVKKAVNEAIKETARSGERQGI